MANLTNFNLYTNNSTTKMSLYYEAAEALASPSTPGSLKSRIFGKKGLKSPPALVYKTALESCKWSGVLKEVIENSELLRCERKVCVFGFFLCTSSTAGQASGILRGLEADFV
jgi:hypothetical protein